MIRKQPQGFGIAFEVLGVDSGFATARTIGLEIIPNGLLFDVSSNSGPSTEFVQKYMS